MNADNKEIFLYRCNHKLIKFQWQILRPWLKKEWFGPGFIFISPLSIIIWQSHHWRRGVVVIATAQLLSITPELRLCTGSNPARGVSEIRDVEDLWHWSRLEIRLNALRRSTIPQKQLKEKTIYIFKQTSYNKKICNTSNASFNHDDIVISFSMIKKQNPRKKCDQNKSK